MPIERPATGAERRKVNRLVDRAVALAIAQAGSVKLGQLDPFLMPTNRVCERWAVSIGSGHPSEEWDDAPIAKPPPLDDQTAIIVDQIILHSPRSRLVRYWFKTPIPSCQVADLLGLSRSGMYLQFRAALMELRGKFYASRHIDLLRILDSHV